MTRSVVAQMAEQRARCARVNGATARRADQRTQLGKISRRIGLDIRRQRGILGDQLISPALDFMVREARLRARARQIIEGIFEFGDIDLAHQSADELSLPALRFMRGDAAMVGERFGEDFRQRQCCALFVVQLRKLLTQRLQSLCIALTSGFAGFFFAHGRHGSTNWRFNWTPYLRSSHSSEGGSAL